MQTERLVCERCGLAVETPSDLERVGTLPALDLHRDPMVGLTRHVVYACVDCGELMGVS